MENIVELFKENTTEGAKDMIIDNLKNVHHGKWVNEMCTTRGFKDFSRASDMLHALIGERRVEVRQVPMVDARGRNISLPLYRYNSMLEFNSL